MAFIKLNNLSTAYLISGTNKLFKSEYRFIKALKNISLEFGDGDRVGIIGQNGSGKSTLLKVLSGAMPPKGGSIETGGELLALLSRTSGLLPRASLSDNAMIKAYSLGLTGDLVHNFVAECLQSSQLDLRKNDPLSSLSTGMSGRFNLALNSQVVRPITVLDEWVGTLDNIQIGQQGILQKLNNDADILVLASHNETLIRRLCNKVVLLDLGKMMYFGDDLDHAFTQFNQLKFSANQRLQIDHSNIPARSRIADQKTIINILMFPRTGGYVLKELLQDIGLSDYQFVFHKTDVSLLDIPQGELVLFFTRNPLERYVRAFTIRLNQGAPFYGTKWSQEESEVFVQFKSAQALAESLTHENLSIQFDAFRAIGQIQFVDMPLDKRLGSMEYLASRKNDLFFIGNADYLFEELTRLFVKLGLGTEKINRLNPQLIDYFGNIQSDELSVLARSNIKQLFHKQFKYQDFLKSLMRSID